MDVDTSALLLFTIFPLLSLIHYLFFEHKRSHANNSSADRDFERLIAQFRAADPQRLGLSLESIEQLVGPSAVLREKVAEGGPLSRRITVAEFVPIACHLSTLPSTPSKPACSGTMATQSFGIGPTTSKPDVLTPRPIEVAPNALLNNDADGQPVDVNELASWLAAEHRRALNVVLLSAAAEAPHAMTAAVASEIVASDSKVGRTVAAAGPLPVNEDGIRLCLSLLRMLRSLALSADLLGDDSSQGDFTSIDPHRKGNVSAPEPADQLRQRWQVQQVRQQSAAAADAAAALVKDALVAGELPERCRRLLHASFSPGSSRLLRLQLELRAAAAATLRTTVEGAPPPPTRVALLWRFVRPLPVRRLLTEYVRRPEQEQAANGREGAAYAEQLAMLHNALSTVAEEVERAAANGSPQATRVAAEIAGDVAADAKRAGGSRRADTLLRRVMCVPLPSHAALFHPVAGEALGERNAGASSGTSGSLKWHASTKASSNPVVASKGSLPEGIQRIWFIVPREGAWLLHAPHGAALFLRSLVSVAVLRAREQLSTDAAARGAPTAEEVAVRELDSLARLLYRVSHTTFPRAGLHALLTIACHALAMPSVVGRILRRAFGKLAPSSAVEDECPGQCSPRERYVGSHAVVMASTVLRVWPPDAGAMGGAAALTFGASVIVAATSELASVLVTTASAAVFASIACTILGLILQPLLLQAWWSHANLNDDGLLRVGVVHFAYLLRVRYAASRGTKSLVQPSEQAVARALGLATTEDGRLHHGGSADYALVRACLLPAQSTLLGKSFPSDFFSSARRLWADRNEGRGSTFGEDTAHLTAVEAATAAAEAAAVSSEAMLPSVQTLGDILLGEAELLTAVQELRLAISAHHSQVNTLHESLSAPALAAAVAARDRPAAPSQRAPPSSRRRGPIQSAMSIKLPGTPRMAVLTAGNRSHRGAAGEVGACAALKDNPGRLPSRRAIAAPAGSLAAALPSKPFESAAACCAVPASDTSPGTPESPKVLANLSVGHLAVSHSTHAFDQQEGANEEEEGEGESQLEDDDDSEDDGWFFTPDGVSQNGPSTVVELGALKASGDLPDESLFWRSGLHGWLPLEEIPLLHAKITMEEEKALAAEEAALAAEEAALAARN